jgi:hypothetical protein
MITGMAPAVRSTPPICAARENVHALSDLSARTDQRVTIESL